MSFLVNSYIFASAGWITSITGMPANSALFGIALSGTSLLASGWHNKVSGSNTTGDCLGVAFNETDGSVLWQKTDVSSTTNITCFASTVDTNGKLRGVGSDSFEPQFYAAALQYWNADGSVVGTNWLHDTNASAGWDSYLFGICAGNNGEIFASGFKSGSPSYTYHGLLIKLNSDNTLAIQANISNIRIIQGKLSRYSGYLHSAGYTTDSTAKGFIGKISESLSSASWGRSLTAASAVYMNGCVTDGSGNVYAYGYIGSSPTVGVIVKYDSSGNIQWQKKLYHATRATTIETANVLNDGSIVVLGSVSSTNSLLYAKIDASGNLIWQYDIANSLGTLYMSKTSQPSADGSFVYVCGGVAALTGAFGAKLPTNALSAGVHGNWTISSGQLSYGDAGMTSATFTITFVTVQSLSLISDNSSVTSKSYSNSTVLV